MNKSSLKSFGLATTMASIVVGYTGIAQAAQVSTTGIWTDAEISDPATLTGVGTNQISWGTPVGTQKSSYVFDGVTNDPLPAPETDFLLGTFTHNNFPIFFPSITGATLELDLSITNGNVLNQSFTFNFAHNETPNTAPCNPSGSTICPDVVSFLNNGESNETITIDGVEYALFISGFQQGGVLVDQFITEEGQANSAQLFGRLGTPTAIPEPLTMLGVGTAMGFGTFFKRRLAKKR